MIQHNSNVVVCLSIERFTYQMVCWSRSREKRWTNISIRFMFHAFKIYRYLMKIQFMCWNAVYYYYGCTRVKVLKICKIYDFFICIYDDMMTTIHNFMYHQFNVSNIFYFSIILRFFLYSLSVCSNKQQSKKIYARHYCSN